MIKLHTVGANCNSPLYYCNSSLNWCNSSFHCYNSLLYCHNSPSFWYECIIGKPLASSIIGAYYKKHISVKGELVTYSSFVSSINSLWFSMSYREKILRIDKQFLPFQRIPHTQLWALAGFPPLGGGKGEVYFAIYWLLTNYKSNYNLKMTCET